MVEKEKKEKKAAAPKAVKARSAEKKTEDKAAPAKKRAPVKNAAKEKKVSPAAVEEPKKAKVAAVKKAKPVKETVQAVQKVTPASPVAKTVPPAPAPVTPKESTVKPAPKAVHTPVAPIHTAPPVPPKPQVVAPVKAPEPVVAKEPEPKPEPEVKIRVLEFETPISLKDLALRIGVKSNELIIKLMGKKMLATINQNLGEDVVKDILKDYTIEYRKPGKVDDQIGIEHRELEDKQDIKHIVSRSPVVTFMGHVDHGKTSLLDFIRKTHVADREKGGITQHIGAYEVKMKHGSVTFLDTPGHEAFTAMRARGANATDVVVLVIAADDGVMPQTKEAIDHARVAGVTIVVALNKCDLPGANIEKVKTQLAQIGLSPEDWGGKTICVPVSAKTGEGVEALLEMLLLESELLELKANPKLRGRGIVIEGKLSSGQGPVATVLVKNGTLHVGDMVVSGMHYGRVKAMIDDKGVRIESAGPSKPVSILGLSGVPMAGDEFFVVKDEKKARTLSLLKQDEDRARKLRSSKRITLEDFYRNMKEGGVKELAIVIKGDVQGSIEALQASLFELSTKDVKVNILHSDVGNINESDVMLSVVSNAVIIGFNVRIDENAETIAAKEGIEIKLYGIIYEAIEDVRAAMEGLLEPISKEIFVGRALVKQVFKVTKAGTIAGCMVVKGKIVRQGIAKLIRDKEVAYEGKIASLKRFKDDVKEAAEGFECGIGLDRHDDIKAGDIIELYQIEKVARRLESRR
ncbi:MAG: translation initiation factor IF-2 [Candidatus Omnitrophota bacterium]|jgi:translation initiation factor IF-2